jgi:hypothetical protein
MRCETPRCPALARSHPLLYRRCPVPSISPVPKGSIAVLAITLRDKAMSEYDRAQLERGGMVVCRMKLISALLTKLIYANPTTLRIK